MISTDTDQTQIPEYIWDEPSLSWKTQEELDQIVYDRQQLEEYNRKKEQERLEAEDEERLRLIEEEEQARLRAIYEYTVPRVYAHLAADGITVENTLLASREYMEENPHLSISMIETDGSVSIGQTYSHDLNAFIPPKPYESWILNEETIEWEAPVPKPTA
jgi:predicted nucleotidyltransferase